MACASINYNNSAISHIDNAIKLYEEAANTIKGSGNKANSNPSTDEILKNIETEVGHLHRLRGRITEVNTNINNEMRKKEQEEKETEEEIKH